MARSIDPKTGCSVAALLALIILLIGALGYYYVWKVDSTGYTAPVPTNQPPPQP